ncbi:MAG: sigma-70 family RNA polymerase sigma factor [Fuerstiella sp.]|nr:sigma-70 family RNA polymerase sigma factor [Fuerstiella sp.]
MSAVSTLRGSSEENHTPPEQSLRAKRIIQCEVKFIYCSEFDQPRAESRILKMPTSQATARRREAAPSDVPGHLLHLWEIPLLTADQERDLFRRMNYLKYRSNALRSRLKPDRPVVRHMDDIERMLAEATEVRNHIVQANTRLVVSIARRLMHVPDAFDEMISTGNMVLIKAVERFDYSRGFRFSTYATHSVRRELFRSFGQRQKLRLSEVSTAPEILLDSVENRDESRNYQEQDRKVNYVRSLMEKVLPEREQKVVISRFGLDSGSGHTLREIGEAMGLSKERVRQLHLRAIDRLQAVAITDMPDILRDSRSSNREQHI